MDLNISVMYIRHDKSVVPCYCPLLLAFFPERFDNQ